MDNRRPTIIFHGGNGEIIINKPPHPASTAAGVHRVASERGTAALLLAILFASGVGATELESGPDGSSETFRLTTVYAAEMHTEPAFHRAIGYTMHHGKNVSKANKSDIHPNRKSARLPRAWIPVDLSMAPNGELWLIQRLQQSPGFDDMTECPLDDSRPSDCEGLLGSTVALRQPQAAEPASAANGRAKLVIDYNAWHFMRRPSAIAFGSPEIWLEADDPGAIHDGRRLLDKRVAYTDTFATCAEHRTANFSDQLFFIGPTLWSVDPTIYNGSKGAYDWSNGAHLDMLHGTAYCMGIAFERDTRYWVFNGHFGTLDHYDFGAPHYPGHHYHGDATATRYRFGEKPLTRLPNVPSNMALAGKDLFIADSGNGRLVAFDTTAKGRFAENHLSLPPEMLRIPVHEGIPLREIASRQTLSKLWGDDVAPSGLALLNTQILALANHASGHVTLLDLDGTVLRNIDTGLGKGIGGMTALDGALYFAHMVTRKVYRLEINR